MEEYMESELSGIFRVKLVTKNVVRGSPGTQFMHVRVKGSCYINFLKFFPIIFFDEKFTLPHKYLFIKDLVFVIFSACVIISS